MTLRLRPIEVPGYVIPYIIKECAGVHVIKEEDFFIDVKIEPNSVFGMFLSRTIRPDYKVKFYNLTIYTKKIGMKRAFSLDILEFKNEAEFQIDLTFDELDRFYRFIDTIFNATYFFYVLGYKDANNKNGIRDGINSFIDKYDLHEYGFNYNQLRTMFNRYKESGSGVSFINNKSKHLLGKF